MLNAQVLAFSFANLLLLGIASFLVYWTATFLYRAYLHPLARFPGPRLAAATYWYEFYHDLIAGPYPGQGAANIDRLHDRYGPIVRVSPDELAVRDPDWIEVLYKSGRRDKWAKNSKANGSPGSVASTVDHAVHRARRAPLTPFFSKRGVTALESTIKVKVDQLTEGVDKQFLQRGRILEVAVPFTALTLDVISDYCFGQSWRCLSAPDFAPEWKTTMTELFLGTPVIKQFPWIGQVMGLFPMSALAKINPGIAMLQGAKDQVQKQVERIVAECEDSAGHGPKSSLGRTAKEGEENNPRTIFQAVLESSLPASEKTVERITDEAFVVVVAGGETTARTLSYAVFNILESPSWKHKVQKEIDAAMPNANTLPSSADLEKLPILTAVIKETLRHTLHITNRVQVMDPAEELQYQSWTIPRNTPISMSIPRLHRDANIFKDPNTWNPGRFLGDEAPLANKYYMPFHRGFRNCLGMNLAYTEIYLGLAAMMRRFELELFETTRERDVESVRDCFLGYPTPESKGVRVRVLAKRM